MKQSLNLRLGQQLSLTPQLQQSLKLLQMSTLDLQQEIQQALESNMMLEIEEDSSEPLFDPSLDKRSENIDSQTSEGSQTDVPDELPIDSSWEDIYENAMVAAGNASELIDFEPQNTKSSTLLDHLLWQLELTHTSERDRAIAITIIDSINEDGYLVSSLEDIFQSLQNQLDDLDFDEVIAVLHLIQSFEPIGVGARNLSECLSLQLKQLPDSTPYKTDALAIVT
ncbi:MAG: RNA polymerase factor sigma-54, partial [Methylococcaceae bacterium]|nr:RNA polymerase factor sigma-54 [Methylococcaceae bacterium]